MTDDRQKKGVQDRTRINTSEDYELRYWTEMLGVTQDQLKAAVNKVGNSVSAVEKELKAAQFVPDGIRRCDAMPDAQHVGVSCSYDAFLCRAVERAAFLAAR